MMIPLIRLVAVVSIAICPIAAIVDAASGFPSGGFTAFNGALATLFIVVGWLLAERRPGNAVGPLLLAFGAFYAWYLPADLYLHLSGQPAGAAFAAMFVSMLDAPMFVVVALVLILFPDGRLPSPRWWPAPWIGVTSIAMTLVGATFDGGPLPLYPLYRSPLSIPGFPGQTFVYASYTLMLLLLVLGAIALAVRWRRGDPIARAQIKWVVAAGLVVLVAEIVNVATFRPTEPNALTNVLVSIAIGLLPVAIGIAILRYRLYDIDRIVSRTISYGLVTALLVAVFLLVNLGLQGILSSVTSNNALAVAGSTLLVAALFTPARRRVQRAVDQRFDRARYDAERTTAAFSERMRDQVDLPTLARELDATVRQAIAPSSVGLWLRGDGR